MNSLDDETPLALQLRQTAEFKLQMGTAPAIQGWTIGVAALMLLHKLASNPHTAGDSLKLLHELQVHQVELDLQHEQLEESRRELEQRAEHYAALFDFAPVAYFTVDRAGRIIEGNVAAARMLGTERDSLPGLGIDGLVVAGSGPVLRALLDQARSGRARKSCWAQGREGSGWLEVTATIAPSGHHCLLVATPLNDSSPPTTTT